MRALSRSRWRVKHRGDAASIGFQHRTVPLWSCHRSGTRRPLPPIQLRSAAEESAKQLCGERSSAGACALQPAGRRPHSVRGSGAGHGGPGRRAGTETGRRREAASRCRSVRRQRIPGPCSAQPGPARATGPQAHARRSRGVPSPWPALTATMPAAATGQVHQHNHPPPPGRPRTHRAPPKDCSSPGHDRAGRGPAPGQPAGQDGPPGSGALPHRAGRPTRGPAAPFATRPWKGPPGSGGPFHSKARGSAEPETAEKATEKAAERVHMRLLSFGCRRPTHHRTEPDLTESPASPPWWVSRTTRRQPRHRSGFRAIRRTGP